MSLTLEEKIQMVLEGKDPNQQVIPASVDPTITDPASVQTQDPIVPADAPEVDDPNAANSDNVPEEPVVSLENPLSVDPLVQPDDTKKVEESKEQIEEMAMDTLNHPTHGKLSWENNGGVHEIKKAGKTVFSGNHEEVASRWKAIKQSIQESSNEFGVLRKSAFVAEGFAPEELSEDEQLTSIMEGVSKEKLIDTAYSWHGGMSSPLYSFASTGGKVHNEEHRKSLVGELDQNIKYATEHKDDPEYKGEAKKLNAVKDHVLSAPLAIKESKKEDFIEADAQLSEEFKLKAKEAFEEELQARTKAVEENYVTKLASIIEKLEGEKAEYINTLSEKIDTYMDSLSESWAVSNKEILESKARVEISESFMTKLKDLFEEHNIEVPEAKRDMVTEMEVKMAEMQGQIKSLTETLQESSVELSKLNKEKVISESVKGMTELDQARMLKLIEDVEYDNEANFAKKIATIQESVFMKPTQVLNEEKLKVSSTPIIEGKEVKATTTVMDLYLKALQG